MDHNMIVIKEQGDQEINLPPGFRFHPTDEELITHYLCKRIIDGSFAAVAIGEADLNKCEPWDLPGKAKMGETEWYFFYLRDRKYPTGSRTNRATEAGYWKATGKDKEIFKGGSLIGMKKTLVFYTGRAPRGEKSNWVMHEYRFEAPHNLPQSAKTEWVISRVFEKSCNGKKVHIPGGARSASSFETQSQLPPLMDFSDVSCFSNQTSFSIAQTDLISSCSITNDQLFRNRPNPYVKFAQANYIPVNYQFPGSMPVQDHPMMKNYSEYNSEYNSWQFKPGSEMVSVSPQETGSTTDMNGNEMSNLKMGRWPFEEGSGSGVGPLELEPY